MTFGGDSMDVDHDLDGDGKVSPWERLCMLLLAGCVAIVLGKELI